MDKPSKGKFLVKDDALATINMLQTAGSMSK